MHVELETGQTVTVPRRAVSCFISKCVRVYCVFVCVIVTLKTILLTSTHPLTNGSTQPGAHKST